jgi:hypothetical protein
MYEETSVYDVPLMAGRGYTSHTYLYSAAEAMQEIGKPSYIYYFGNYDPRGLDISRFVEEYIREYAEGINITFERVALTREQIDRWNLPTRPTKQEKSGFGKSFDRDSVDIHTMDPRDLRALVRACIEQHVGPHDLESLRTAELEERNFLRWLAGESPTWRDEHRLSCAPPGHTLTGTPEELTERLRLTLNGYLASHDMSWDDIVGAASVLHMAVKASQRDAERQS